VHEQAAYRSMWFAGQPGNVIEHRLQLSPILQIPLTIRLIAMAAL
jgi:hypothetical protein